MELISANTRLEKELMLLLDKTRKSQKISRASWIYLAIVDKLSKSFTNDQESLDILNKIHPLGEVENSLEK